MANTLRIKRRAAGGAAGAPASLENAELAFNEQDDVLYYGKGTGGAGGTATTIIPIGGPGAFAGLASPALTGTPTAPTAALNTSTTQIATTAFVLNQANDTAGTIAMNGTQAAGSSELYARADHVHPSDTSRAPLASPTFTGTPAAPTAGADTNTTQLATTAFVLGQASSTSPAALGTAAVGTSLRYARADHVHQMPTLSQVGTPTANISLGNFRITNLGTPTADTDAATKLYVDQVAQGLDAKQSVRAATTANITLSATQTIDGISVVAGERVLVKNQTTPSQNGIYVVAAGAWTRATDMDAWAEVPSAFTFVEQGSTQADTSWVCSSDQGGTLGTTAITWVQFGSAASFIGGAGLTLDGNTFNVGTASTGRIVVNADNIDLATVGTAGTYRSVTTDAYGRVTAGTNPTTLAGYGITDAQPLDATLTALAGVTTSADTLIYATGADTFTTTSLTAAGRALLDDADAAAQRTTLGLVIGTNVQAYDAGLQSIAGLTTVADRMIYTTASDTYAVTPLTSFGRSLVDDADAAAARTTLGLVIGTNVQAYDAGLQSIAGLTTVADRMIYTTASDTYAVTTLTAFGRSLVDDADAAAGRTTLGLGTIATQAANNVAITGGSITNLTTFDGITIDGGTF